ncbi:MAG: hypothetical protein OEO83_10090 [Alphaproteobacteria bacterium]|nr:hypothetical protein [Alphaproteobacteria bacterium]
MGTGPDKGFKLFGNDGLTFGDLLDTINPLHHLPVVGFIYRAVTGDTISPASLIAGGALFGGPIGLAASVADTMLKEASGRDAGGHLLSLVQGKDTENSLPLFKPDAETDSQWDEVAQLRHDANEFEDWRPLTAAPGTALAAAAKVPDGPSRSIAAAPLLYDDYDTESAADEAAPASPVKGAASAAPVPAQAAAGLSLRPGLVPRKVAPTGIQAPVAGGAATQSGAQAAVAARLPAARALAANPTMVTALRKGESAYFRPGGSLNSDAWLKLMHNAGAKGKGGRPPTGAGGLSSATIAKALAKYGAAAQNPAAAAGK